MKEWKEGLPPVGTICECQLMGVWWEVEIIAHHKSNAIFISEGVSPEYNGRCADSFRTLRTEKEKAIYFDGRNEYGEHVASGVYFYHLVAGDYSATKKMVIMK